ncbi:hypothetical protein Afil01_51600 [Actinorhabdospora filicis]|uniref:Uncharacterized protein n=1 Tax=Actinorhabdospora filicis TaxID=1785913 RepID=A0A9W6SQP0_9ACTN|nr:hypothetical protein [Actinorhabdospora filicis]GLZ80353.1 hypothetical protein Afil01_51600 [Actinorhabdospora filicis]
MRWPWSKKEHTEAEAPSPPSAPLPEIRAPRGEWRSLPAVQRVVESHPTVNPPADFAAGLTTRRTTAFLGSLGHTVSGSAPGGVVSVQAIRTSDVSDLPVLRALPAADESRPAPMVQRSFAPSPSAVLPIAQPPTAGVETPAAWELPVVSSGSDTAAATDAPAFADEPVAPTLGGDISSSAPEPSTDAPVITHESAPMPDTPVVTRPVGGPVGPPIVQRSTTSIDLPSAPASRRRGGLGPPISSSVDGALPEHAAPSPEVAPTLGTADPLGGETVQRAVATPVTPPPVDQPVVRSTPPVAEPPAVQRLALPGTPVSAPESTGPSSFTDFVAAASAPSVSTPDTPSSPAAETAPSAPSVPDTSAPLTSASPLTVARAVDTSTSSPSMSVSPGSDTSSATGGPDLPDLTVARSAAPGTPADSPSVSTFAPPPGARTSVPDAPAVSGEPEFGTSSPATETAAEATVDAPTSEGPAFSEGSVSAESPAAESTPSAGEPEVVAQLIGERGITPPSAGDSASSSPVGESAVSADGSVGPTVQRSADTQAASPAPLSARSFAQDGTSSPASLQRLTPPSGPAAFEAFAPGAGPATSSSSPSAVSPASPVTSSAPLTVARSVASPSAEPASGAASSASFAPPVVARLIGDRGLPASSAVANPISSAVRPNDGGDGGSAATGGSPVAATSDATPVVVPVSYGGPQLSAQTFTTGGSNPGGSFTGGNSTASGVFGAASPSSSSSPQYGPASVQTFSGGWTSSGSLTLAAGSGGATGNGGSISVLGAPSAGAFGSGAFSGGPAPAPSGGAGPLVQRAASAPPAMPMASPPPPPPPVVTEASQPYYVQRADDAAPPPAADPPPPAAAEPAPSAPAAPAPGAPGQAQGEAPEVLLAKLYDPLLRRLRAELRHDRERRGIVTDLWH